MSGCTKHIGIINNISNEYDLKSEKFELAVENVSFTSSSLDSCIHLALISVPNSRYLKNTEIITKGKKVTIRTDIWKSIKTTEGNKKQLKKRSYSNLQSFKVSIIFLASLLSVSPTFSAALFPSQTEN